MNQINQMYALYEFMRTGDTAALLEENIPMTRDNICLTESSLTVPQEDSPSSNELVYHPNLIATDDQWHKLVKIMGQKFPPQRFVPIKVRAHKYNNTNPDMNVINI